VAQSLAILDSRGQVIGGPFNEMMLPLDVAPEFREDDPSMAAGLEVWESVIAQLGPRTRRR
jgi:hypothetical protein